MIRCFFYSKSIGIFLISPWNIWCGYSLEVPRWGTSNEYPQHMFLWRNKKIFTWYPLLSRPMLHCANMQPGTLLVAYGIRALFLYFSVSSLFSVTENEVSLGILKLDHTKQKVLCFQRTLIDLDINVSVAGMYMDIVFSVKVQPGTRSGNSISQKLNIMSMLIKSRKYLSFYCLQDVILWESWVDADAHVSNKWHKNLSFEVYLLYNILDKAERIKINYSDDW